MAKGVATIADSTVTISEPENIGSAPTAGFPSGPIEPGDQFVPNKKLKGLTLSTKNVESPFCATKTRIEPTTKTIRAIHKNVSDLPNFSSLEFLLLESNFSLIFEFSIKT